ncbi:MAG TPA: GreA/GreB family elongation factor [Candidatus Baltobacteraceae bacterium]|nr:GreA/GreB family elongation factor [Candidatus Baltobacteraceae bacterium]
MSRAFVKEDDGDTEVVAKRPQRQHPYYVTPEGLEGLEQQLAAAQASGDERAVEELQARVDTAIVVRPEEQPREIVRFGAGVTVEGPDRKRSTYRIVGEDEADPLKGRISWLSPLAQALLEHHAGDRVVWQRPAGNVPLKIVSISYGA